MTRWVSISYTFVFLFTGLSFCLADGGQGISTTGILVSEPGIYGIVKNGNTWGRLPFAEVAFMDTTGFSDTVVADQYGFYRIQNVPAGDYSLSFTAATFMPADTAVFFNGNLVHGSLSMYHQSEIEGYYFYYNGSYHRLDSVTVVLTNTLTLDSDTVLSDQYGNFSFTVPPGDYVLSAGCSKKWGGANAVDALHVLRQFTGMETLEYLYMDAADADGSGAVNAVDALAIVKRFTGMTNSFTKGDWVFDNFYFTVTQGGGWYMVHAGLCTGDVDGSFIH